MKFREKTGDSNKESTTFLGMEMSLKDSKIDTKNTYNSTKHSLLYRFFSYSAYTDRKFSVTS